MYNRQTTTTFSVNIPYGPPFKDLDGLKVGTVDIMDIKYACDTDTTEASRWLLRQLSLQPSYKT